MKMQRKRTTLSFEQLEDRTTPAVVLNPTTVPFGVVGSTYSQTIVASGATGPFNFAVTSGTLPSGLSLLSDGDLIGTPTTTGDSTFAITATNSTSDSGSQSYTMHVYPMVTVAPTSLSNGAVGSSYSQTVTASGPPAPYTFTVTSGALPAGVSLATNGALTGTPTTAGHYSFTVNAADTNGDFGFRDYTVTIAPPVSQELAVVADSLGNVAVINPNTFGVYLAFRPFDTAANQYVGQMSVALGDVNHDSVPDLIVATRGKRAGKVKVFDGAGIEAGTVTQTTQTIFIAFPIAGYKQGLTVASADVNGDGTDDLIAAGRKDRTLNNPAEVVVYSGTAIKAGGSVIPTTFEPFTSSYTGGVYVAARDTGSGKAEIAVSSSSSSDVQFWQMSGSTFGKLGSDVHPFGSTAFNAAAGDGQIAAVDNGGTIEFVTGHLSGGVTTLDLLNASGATSATYTAGSGASFYALDAIDLDHNGTDDVMFTPVGASGSNTIDLLNPATGAITGTIDSFLTLNGKVTVAGS